MLPAGSGAPPSLLNLSSTCATTGGSVITFSCNKVIASSVLYLALTDNATGADVWTGGFGASVNAKGFAINGTPNGEYTLTADNGENAVSAAVVVNCAGGSGSLVLVSQQLTQPTAAVPTGSAELVVNTSQGAPAPTAPVLASIAGFTTAPVTLSPAPRGYTYNPSGLPTGSYTASFTDSGNPALTLDVPFVILRAPILGCTDREANNYDPNATQDDGTCTYTAPPRFAHFVVPKAQALRFVLPGQPEVPAFDNRLFGSEQPINTTNPGYCQLVERGDTLVIQFQTNYNTPPTVQIMPCGSGPAAATFTPTRIVQGAGESADFDAYARPDTLPGRLRIYFNSDALPLPFLPTNRVTLSSAGALNGTYPIVDVREDAAAAVPYLVLPVAYPSGAQRIDLQLSTTYALQVFDTWQVVLPFSAIPPGCYHVKIAASDTDFGGIEAISEPIDVAVKHRGSLLVVYRNFDNAFNLNYTAGLVNRIRIVARFYDRETATQREVLRESTGRLTLLSAAAQRRILLEAYLLPAYLHEALAVAFCHDFVRVEDVEVVAEEPYEYATAANYTLGKGTILLEQVDFLGAGNRDDVGDVDGGPFLLVNDTFLRVNF